MLCSGEGRRTTKECSSDASETERVLNVKHEVILGLLTAGYVISDNCQTTRLHNTGTTPNLGAPLDMNQHELRNTTINTKRQTRFRNNIMIMMQGIALTFEEMHFCIMLYVRALASMILCTGRLSCIIIMTQKFALT